jgi:ABC-type glycerol-3-phosphate transport system substrate-binding protein
MKKLLVLMVVLMSFSMLFAAGSKEASDSKTDFVISTYLADDAQVAVREIYIDEPLNAAFPDMDIEVKMYNDRQSLQIEVAGGGGPDILDLDGPTDVALLIANFF